MAATPIDLASHGSPCHRPHRVYPTWLLGAPCSSRKLQHLLGCPGLRHGRHLCLRGNPSGMPASHPRQPGDREFENCIPRGPDWTGLFTTGRPEREPRRGRAISTHRSEGCLRSRFGRFANREFALTDATQKTVRVSAHMKSPDGLHQQGSVHRSRHSTLVAWDSSSPCWTVSERFSVSRPALGLRDQVEIPEIGGLHHDNERNAA